MLSTTIFATLLAIAAAVPQAIISTADICGNGNDIHCCNDESVTNQLTGVSLLDDLKLLSDNQCTKLNLPLTDILSFQKQCGTNPVCCGHNSQNGVVNVGCVPIPGLL